DFLALLVSGQNLIFLAPIVPGNLVLLESAGGWLLEQENIPFWASVSAIALMRLVFLSGLLLLGFCGKFFLPSLKHLREAQKASQG
ncbi:MAG: hypothetical protein HQL32_06130, partial [Planctomycetes bacterium]|nr:hypothetical protein [Planctomycetota bacterium]